MPDLLLLADFIAGVLFAGALAMIALSEKELKLARTLVWIAAVIFMARWTVWGFTTDQPVLVRAIIGACAGAFVLVILPASLHWIAEKEKQSSLVPATKYIQIILGTDDAFQSIGPSGVNRNRTIRVRLQNNTDKYISNGKLMAVGLDPPYRGNKDFLLKDSIVVPPHDGTYVDVVAYGEGTSQARPGRNIILITPPSGGFAEAAFVWLPLQGSSFYLKFSTLDGLSDEKFVRAFVDDNHILHLEDANVPPQRNAAALGSESDRINAIEAFLEVVENSKWDTAALNRDIHDRLSLGELHAWGRLEHDRPLVPIPQNEWQTDLAIMFDQRSLDSKSQNACAWKRVPDFRNNRIRYVKVQLSRREMVAIYG